MSKANRIKQQHAEEILRLQSKPVQKTIPAWAIASIIGGIAAVAAAIVVLCILTLNGTFLRNATAVVGESKSSSQRYEMDNAVMAYYFMTNYNEYVSNYSDYISYLGLNTSSSLKNQNYFNGETTWFDYFKDSAKSEVEELITTYIAAVDAGYSDDEISDRVDSGIESVTVYAESAKMSLNKYLSKCYGTGINVEDVRRALTLYYTAQSYYNHLMNSYTFTDSEIDKAYEADPNTYKKCDYRTYTFSADVESDALDSEIKTAEEKIKPEADALAACNLPESFDAALTAYLEKTTEKTADEIKTAVTAAKKVGQTYVKDNEASEWLFDAARKVGDTTVIYSSDAHSYTVYLLTALAARDEYNTVDVRHILFTSGTYGSDAAAKSAAEDVLSEYKKNATEENFANLAREKTEDTGSASVGGLYESVKKGEMVDEFNDWIFDETRQPGDVEIVKTSYGYHIMYFVKQGQIAWKAAVISNLKNDKYSAAYEEFKNNVTITAYDKTIDKLPF